MALIVDLAPIWPAVKTLILFTQATRGVTLRKREIDRIVVFIRNNVSLPNVDNDELGIWVGRHRCLNERDDETEYGAMLRQVSPELLAQCQTFARWIAVGSGRKAIDPRIADWIDSGFAMPPNKMCRMLVDRD